MELNGDEILDALIALPVSTWSYNTSPGVEHLGPMAQDFAAAFGLGSDERVINVVDMHGVLVVAVQALARRMEALANGGMACPRCAAQDEGSARRA